MFHQVFRGAAKSQSVAGWLLTESFRDSKVTFGARQFQNSNRDSSKGLLEKLIRDHGLSAAFDVTGPSIINRQSGHKFLFAGLERNINAIRSMVEICRVWLEESQDISEAALTALWPTVRDKDLADHRLLEPCVARRSDRCVLPQHPPSTAVSVALTFEDNPWFSQTSLTTEMEALKEHNYERYRHIWLGAYEADSDLKVFGRKYGWLSARAADGASYVWR